MIRSSRIGLTHATLALFAAAILVKAADVQIVNGRLWRARAERQQTKENVVPAPRGELLDATNRVLAESREMVRLEIAPWEVNDPRALRKALARLAVDPALIRRAVDTSSKYMTIPGSFLAVDAAPAIALHGVHPNAAISRSYAVSEGARGILGHVDQDDKPIDGLELSLDSILRGTPGSATIIHDPRGQARESPITPGTPPVDGDNVELTINADLQEIAEKSLADAVARMDAEGGDIVILDPHTGEILAMASRRLDPRQTSTTVLTEPFEPGSTAKPFIAAGLIARGLVTDHDSVDTGNGILQVKGRSSPIRDEHLVGRAPLAEVLRWSSNIGIVKFSQRLTPRQEFETFRDFGFGMPTGVPLPSESPGLLYGPKSWSSQSAISMAMGYEISVTPLQLAAAYATFANGGELIEPALIKEIRSPDGQVRYRHVPRVVRRVMSDSVATKVRHMLLDVVDEGTALQAALDNYLLAGKTGTPRATVRGRYIQGRYNPNFVGIFPGDNPQYVIVVKLTAPKAAIYAAETAAPVTKAILEAAIAARNAALDRGKLASSELPPSTGKRAAPVRGSPTGAVSLAGTARDTVASPASVVASTYVATLPFKPAASKPAVPRVIPDVRGMDLRDAVRSLHTAGFRVRLARGGAGGAATNPAAGELAPSGTLVRLVFDY